MSATTNRPCVHRGQSCVRHKRWMHPFPGPLPRSAFLLPHRRTQHLRRTFECALGAANVHIDNLGAVAADFHESRELGGPNGAGKARVQYKHNTSAVERRSRHAALTPPDCTTYTLRCLTMAKSIATKRRLLQMGSVSEKTFVKGRLGSYRRC